MKEKIISIHSSRGGTGKTVIATNLAAIYANRGMNVTLLDLDFRAPSLIDVFSKGIKAPVRYWLNDFLDGKCNAEQTLADVSEAYHLKGRLFVGFANPAIAAIRNIMDKSRAWEVTAVKRLFSMRSTLFREMNVSCCILDTSPGIQYTSINAVVSSDIAIVVATPDSLELKGLESMVKELYDEFAKKTVILINKAFSEVQIWAGEEQKELVCNMEKTLKHPVIGVLPCYCDILQAKRTSILAVDKPHHPFLGNLEEVAIKLEQILENMEEGILCATES